MFWVLDPILSQVSTHNAIGAVDEVDQCFVRRLSDFLLLSAAGNLHVALMHMKHTISLYKGSSPFSQPT